jgi:hypothetical protein
MEKSNLKIIDTFKRETQVDENEMSYEALPPDTNANSTEHSPQRIVETRSMSPVSARGNTRAGTFSTTGFTGFENRRESAHQSASKIMQQTVSTIQSRHNLVADSVPQSTAQSQMERLMAKSRLQVRAVSMGQQHRRTLFQQQMH